MPNLAKDMATQTTISESTSESSSDCESDKEEVESKLIKPLEERKKAFIVQDVPLPWKSMPSLVKTETKSQPLPLVGSCYPTKLEEITSNQPLKQIKQKFESKIQSKVKPNHLEVETKPSRFRSNSLSSLNSPPEGGSDIMPLEEAATPSATPSATPATPVVYRWDDESNGEIYTDKPIIDENVNETTENSIGLYVVENGREYPLVPLKFRKSLFEPNPLSKISFKAAKNVAKLHSPVPVEEKKIEPIETIEVIEPKEVVKSSVMPYIIEEQDVLQNINLVSKIKTKFACEN